MFKLQDRDPSSFTDPNGYLIRKDQEIYRVIYPEKADFFRGFLNHPLGKALQADGRLIASEIVQADEAGLVLSHEPIWPVSYPHEWCFPMLKDAALRILDLAAELAGAGYELLDGHPWNVLFRRGQAVFVDVGSIGPAQQGLLWSALTQYRQFGPLPLHLASSGLPELAKARLQDPSLGVSSDLAARSLPIAYKLRHPKLSLSLLAERAIQARLNPKASVSIPRPTTDPELFRLVQRQFFAGLRRELESISLPQEQQAWGAYYDACPSMTTTESAAKDALLSRLLGELNPKTLLDLGTNTGRYALMAANQGARVIAVDQDETSIAKLYTEVKRSQLDVLPVVMGLSNPSPKSGWCSEQWPSAMERFASDTTLFLAVIHHLVFTGNQSLEQVARMASLMSQRHTIIEWIEPNDPMALYLRRTATKDFSFYTMSNMLKALEAEGFQMTVMDPHSPTRRLLVGNKA